MSDFDKILEEVAFDLGVSILMKELPASSGYTFGIRVDGIAKPIGFEYYVRQSLMSWTIDLVLDNFSGELLRTFQESFPEKKSEVFLYLNLAKKLATELKFEVNDISIEEVIVVSWSELVFHIKVKFEPDDNPGEAFQKTLLYSLSLLMPFITDNTDGDYPDFPKGEIEGDISYSLVRKYERSRVNRALCLAEYGYTCRACDVLMEQRYGINGKNVIEVHHSLPVSQMGEARVIDPLKELVPLCPNCHTIAHKKNPPLPVEVLREMINSGRE